MTYQEQAERFNQYHKAVQELNNLYKDKLSKLSIKWIQKEDEMYPIITEEQQILLDELGYLHSILRKVFNISTEYGAED